MPYIEHSLYTWNYDDHRSFRAPPLPDLHLAAIGRLVTNCSRLEGSLHQSLRWRIGASDEVSRILISDATVSRIIERLREVDPHPSAPEEQLVFDKRMLKESAYVFRVRNIVAHRNAVWRDDWLRFDNIPTAKRTVDPRHLVFPLTVEQINNLAELSLLVSPSARQMPLSQIKDWTERVDVLIRDRALPEDPHKFSQRISKDPQTDFAGSIGLD